MNNDMSVSARKGNNRLGTIEHYKSEVPAGVREWVII